MILTEAEAKTKQCRAIAVSNDGAKSGPSKCVASECCHWREAGSKRTKAYLEAVADHMKATGDNFNKATNIVWPSFNEGYEGDEGYCGLAGKPE